MIGEPMNFQHTAHIGSRDVEIPNDQLSALQMQMMSKGGYETTYKVFELLLKKESRKMYDFNFRIQIGAINNRVRNLEFKINYELPPVSFLVIKVSCRLNQLPFAIRYLYK